MNNEPASKQENQPRRMLEPTEGVQEDWKGLYQAFDNYIDVFLRINELPPNEQEFLVQFEHEVQEILHNFVHEVDWKPILEKFERDGYLS